MMPAGSPPEAVLSAGKLTRDQVWVSNYATILAAILFGAVHCCAWSFQFPSQTERSLWRMCSVLTVALPVAWGLLLVLDYFLTSDRANFIPSNWAKLMSRIIFWAIYITSALYLIARGGVLMISFYSLRSLPPDAYEPVSWTFIRHI